jgi:hypothetical protein
MQPVIFLDIDGVLNSFRWMERAPLTPGTSEADAARVVARAAGYLHVPPQELARDLQRLDPGAIGRLAGLVRATDSAIVISSSWRAVIDHQGLEELFTQIADWPRGSIRDQTPMLDMLFDRGREIDAWLQGHPCQRYVILDDLPPAAFPGHEHRLVQTDMEAGLEDEHCVYAEKLLTAR